MQMNATAITPNSLNPLYPNIKVFWSQIRHHQQGLKSKYTPSHLNLNNMLLQMNQVASVSCSLSSSRPYSRTEGPNASHENLNYI